jgi:hypothetical protein
MKRFGLFLFLFLGVRFLLLGQCTFSINELDEFDSTLIIATPAVNIGYLIASEYLEEDGIKLIEEAKVILSYGELNNYSNLFLTLVTPERSFSEIEPGTNLLLKLSNDTIVGLINYPDRGTFNRSINMRIYNHTAIIPIDVFFALAHYPIEKIRINYNSKKRNINVTPNQASEILKHIRCLGEGAGLLPVQP